MTTKGGSRYDAAANYRALVARVARLEALLTRLEWAGDIEGLAACPDCHRYKPSAYAPMANSGHDHGCELAAELGRGVPLSAS